MAISRPTEPMIRRPIRVPAFVTVWVMTPKPQAQAARPVPIEEARDHPCAFRSGRSWGLTATP
jgi:hypothetical protein